ncbi:MAG: type IV pili methyl-accepting chemotaxis transducer N-terminal domain-containing protein [Pseudomonadota bacterium]
MPFKKPTHILALAALLSLPIGAISESAADEAQALQTLAELHNHDPLTRDVESDGADRIRLADRLTMLTQRVAAASCALTSDVATQEAYFHLEEAMHEIDIILVALTDGNEALHILGPEHDRRTLHDIEGLRQEWLDTHGAVEDVLRDGHDVDAAHVIDDHNLKLLELSTVLVADIMGQYSHPYEMTQSDAMLITIAGRQRMLTQKMAKDACEIWTGYHAEEGRADLIETMAVFENSLNALRFGMPNAGVKEAPTDEIRADLDSILGRWAVIRGNLDLLIAGEDLDMDQKFEIFHDFNVELDELDHLIQDYALYAKRHHG